MTLRAKVWLALAVLFTLVNLAGGIYAVLHGELLHTCIHAVLVLVGQYFVWRLLPKRTTSY